MIKQTFNKNKLLFEEFINEKEQTVKIIDYSNSKPYEKHYKYENNLLTAEVDVQDNIELNRIEYFYDTHKRVIKKLLFISEELYESTLTNYYEDNDYEEIIIQDGIEVDKIIKKRISKEISEIRFFYEGKLDQLKKITENKRENIITTEIFDKENKLLAKTIEKYNNDNFLLSSTTFNEKNNILEETKFELVNDLVYKKAVKNFHDYNYEIIILYEYDQNKNLVKEECRDISGNLLGFYLKEYDSNNRLICEKGANNGSFDSISGINNNYSNYEISYRYLD